MVVGEEAAQEIAGADHLEAEMVVATDATEAEEVEADQAREDQESSEKEDASYVEKKDTSKGIAQTQEAAEDHQ